MSPEAIERSKKGRFKKGNHPPNEMPIGSIRTVVDGYLAIKTSMEGKTNKERWDFLHHAVWKEHNGPIPEGYTVAFRDGDKTNVSIDNLMLVSRAESAVMSKFHLRTKDPAAMDTALAVAKLKIAITKKKKVLHEHNGKKKDQ